MRKIAAVIIACALLLSLAYATDLLFSDQERSAASCQRLADQLNEELLDGSLEGWFDDNKRAWASSQDRPSPRIPLGKGQFTVDPPTFMADLGFGANSEAQVLVSKGAISTVQLVDSDAKSIIISADSHRWYGWNLHNLRPMSSRVAVVCPVRD